jgi:hypothetical protein
MNALEADPADRNSPAETISAGEPCVEARWFSLFPATAHHEVDGPAEPASAGGEDPF